MEKRQPHTHTHAQQSHHARTSVSTTASPDPSFLPPLPFFLPFLSVVADRCCCCCCSSSSSILTSSAATSPDSTLASTASSASSSGSGCVDPSSFCTRAATAPLPFFFFLLPLF